MDFNFPSLGESVSVPRMRDKVASPLEEGQLYISKPHLSMGFRNMLATSWGRQFETAKAPKPQTQTIPKLNHVTIPMEPKIANLVFDKSMEPMSKIIPADRYSTGIVFDKVNTYTDGIEPESKLSVYDFSPIPGTRTYEGERLEKWGHVNRGIKPSTLPNRILLENNFKPSTIDNSIKWCEKFSSDIKSELSNRENQLTKNVGNINYATAPLDDFVNAKEVAENYKKTNKKRGPTADPLSHIVVARPNNSVKWSDTESKKMVNYILDQLPEGCQAYVGRHFDPEKRENALHIVVKRTDKDGKLLLNSSVLTSKTLAIQAQMIKDKQSYAYHMPALDKFVTNLDDDFRTKSIDCGLEDCGLLSCKGAVKDSIAMENYISK